MSFKKHNWTGFNTGGNVLNIIVEDETRTKIDSFRFSTYDKKNASKVIKILKDKYGLSLDTEEFFAQDIDEEEFKMLKKDFEW